MIVVFEWIFLIGILSLTGTVIMPLFTIEPYVVAADLITAWKFAWRQIWKTEETQSVQVHLRTDSNWLMGDDDIIPLCPYHSMFCVMDIGIKDFDTWKH